MSSVKEMLTNIREYIGNPPHERLNNATICQHLYDNIDHLLNRLNLTESNWIIDRQRITVNPNNNEYLLNANFGRATVVETVPDGSTSYRRREIDIVEYQDFNLYWAGYTESYVYSGYTHNAEVCCFYGLQGDQQKRIRFAPMPGVSCDYQIWYEVGAQPPPKLNEAPRVMQQFHNLLKVLTAKACLPHCFDGSEQEQAIFQNHWVMLSEKEAQFDEVYERYIQQGYQEDVGPRRSFNSGRAGWEGW